MANEAIHPRRLEEIIVLIRQDVQRCYPYIASLFEFEIACSPYNSQQVIRYMFGGHCYGICSVYYHDSSNPGIDTMLTKTIRYIAKGLEHIASMIINYNIDHKKERSLPALCQIDKIYPLTNIWFNLSMSVDGEKYLLNFGGGYDYIGKKLIDNIEKFLADCYGRNDAYWQVLHALPMPIADEVKYFLWKE